MCGSGSVVSCREGDSLIILNIKPWKKRWKHSRENGAKYSKHYNTMGSKLKNNDNEKIPNSVEYLETVFIYQNQITANQIISSN